MRGVWAESHGDILSVFVAALIFFAWALRPWRSVQRARRRPTASERRRLPPSISSDRQDRSQPLSLVDARLPTMTLATSLGAVATAHEGSLGIDRGLARHVSAPLSAVREEEEAAEQVAHLLAIKTNVAAFKDIKALIRSQPDVSRAADNVAGSSAQAMLTSSSTVVQGSCPYVQTKLAPDDLVDHVEVPARPNRASAPEAEDKRMQARHCEWREQSDFNCFAISKSSATSSPSSCLPSSLVAAALSPVSQKTPSPKTASSAEATPLLFPSAAATTRRALATAPWHEGSLGIEHGFAAARHQVGAPIADDSLVQSETEDRVRKWLNGASSFHTALKPRKFGDGKSERREGMAKRASKLSGSHWQSATRFYTNIVVKRSSSTPLPPSGLSKSYQD